MKINRLKLKLKAHKNLKKNFFMSILIIYLFNSIINNDYIYSTQLLKNSSDALEVYSLVVNKDTKEINLMNLNKGDKEKNNEMMKGALKPIISRLNISTSPLYNFSYSLKLFFYHKKIKEGLYSLFIALLSFILFFTIKLVLDIGKNRFFLESRIYPKTNMIRLLYPYKIKGTLRLSSILFLKRVYQVLWSLTIVGGIIKAYEYKLIPYILAENPTIPRKDVFKMSKEMMNGYKLEAFKLDLSLIGWVIIGILTLGISNIMYYNAYKESLYTEFYCEVRKNKKKSITNSKYLNDTALFENKDNREVYPKEETKVPMKNIEINTDYNQNYSLRNLVLLFFTCCFIGYSWEVFLHIIVDGKLINRGFLLGPWLPIYGTGAILILALLKPFRKNPFTFFISSMILAGIVEYGTHYILELLLHTKWWDYTGYFLNLHGRICLEGLLVFGLGGSVITYFFAPFMNTLFNKIKSKLLIIICFILVALFGADIIHSIFHPNIGEGITDYE